MDSSKIAKFGKAILGFVYSSAAMHTVILIAKLCMQNSIAWGLFKSHTTDINCLVFVFLLDS